MTKTVDISGMDPGRARFDYEWGCQVLMFRALHWLRTHKDEPKFSSLIGVTGIIRPDNKAAEELEDFALKHSKIKEFGATGAMVQCSITHALKRFAYGEEAYFDVFKDEPDRIFEFDESDVLEEGEK